MIILPTTAILKKAIFARQFAHSLFIIFTCDSHLNCWNRQHECAKDCNSFSNETTQINKVINNAWGHRIRLIIQIVIATYNKDKIIKINCKCFDQIFFLMQRMLRIKSMTGKLRNNFFIIVLWKITNLESKLQIKLLYARPDRIKRTITLERVNFVSRVFANEDPNGSTLILWAIIVYLHCYEDQNFALQRMLARILQATN